jgi:hypothetical protein
MQLFKSHGLAAIRLRFLFVAKAVEDVLNALNITNIDPDKRTSGK